MDNKKKCLLDEFSKLARNKTNAEILPLVLAFSQKAHEENIHFDKSDMETILDEMKKNMTAAEYEKIASLVNIMM